MFNAIVVKDLGTLLLISLNNSAIIVKKWDIIKDCPIRPPKKSEAAYNILVGSSNAPNLGQSFVTLEMI